MATDAPAPSWCQQADALTLEQLQIAYDSYKAEQHKLESQLNTVRFRAGYVWDRIRGLRNAVRADSPHVQPPRPHMKNGKFGYHD